MSNRKALEPIEHRPVYKRIELGQRRHEPPSIATADGPYIGPEKQERLWAITRQTAEGCNAPSIAPIDAVVGIPVEVDTAGWDAA